MPGFVLSSWLSDFYPEALEMINPCSGARIFIKVSESSDRRLHAECQNKVQESLLTNAFSTGQIQFLFLNIY